MTPSLFGCDVYCRGPGSRRATKPSCMKTTRHIQLFSIAAACAVAGSPLAFGQAAGGSSGASSAGNSGAGAGSNGSAPVGGVRGPSAPSAAGQTPVQPILPVPPPTPLPPVSPTVPRIPPPPGVSPAPGVPGNPGTPGVGGSSGANPAAGGVSGQTGRAGTAPGWQGGAAGMVRAPTAVLAAVPEQVRWAEAAGRRVVVRLEAPGAERGVRGRPVLERPAERREREADVRQ